MTEDKNENIVQNNNDKSNTENNEVTINIQHDEDVSENEVSQIGNSNNHDDKSPQI